MRIYFLLHVEFMQDSNVSFRMRFFEVSFDILLSESIFLRVFPLSIRETNHLLILSPCFHILLASISRRLRLDYLGPKPTKNPQHWAVGTPCAAQTTLSFASFAQSAPPVCSLAWDSMSIERSLPSNVPVYCNIVVRFIATWFYICRIKLIYNFRSPVHLW